MAHYTGPACRLCRRLSVKLFLKGDRCTTKCAVERRSAPPGQQYARRRKVSEWGSQLREKQKARYLYGVLERQFRKTFSEAERGHGVTGETLYQLLERRLDNVVYRLGFASSRSQARQLVRHGHITINGKKTDIPSMLIKQGDVIAFKESSTQRDFVKAIGEKAAGVSIPSWLSIDRENLKGTILSLPSRGDSEIFFDEKLVVEFYSRR
jgi:small subunit ribosomal protein S4